MPPPPREQSLARLWLAAGVGNAFTSALLNPLDAAKTRMQTTGTTSLLATLAGMWRAGGVAGVWAPGLSASVLREFVYSGPRVGFYTPVRDAYAARLGAAPDAAAVKVAAALTTGAASCVLANPIDVAKIRLQREPARYAGALAALRDIAAAEGARGLARGLAPSTLRGAALSVGQLAIYDIVKTALRDAAGLGEGARLHVAAALATGVAAAVCAAPFDMLKARCMAGEGGGAPATMRDVLRALHRERALPGALFRGVLPAYLRQGPHALIMLPVMERLRALLGLDPV